MCARPTIKHENVPALRLCVFAPLRYVVSVLRPFLSRDLPTYARPV